MATDIEYALMAGRVYQSTRGKINWLPDLQSQGWTEFFLQQKPSGFEAISFQKGNEVVISFAGTGSKVDWWANAGGFFGVTSDQLRQAADYYLQVKAANLGVTISLTGHSLGGGLASLMAVFFGETATTFDQAPFRNSASVTVANDLMSYLSDPARGYNTPALTQALIQALQGLTNFTNATASGDIPNESNVHDFSVQGEVLSAASGLRIGTPANLTSLTHGAPDLMLTFDLHSQALLTAFLQSDQTAPSQHSFRDVTIKLPDVVRMIFDGELFENPTASGKENFIDRLVRHQNGVAGLTVGEIPIPADAMVTRFTTDLWQIAQDGGLTLNEANLSRALTAFAMQKYYDETQASAGYNKILFTGVTGGIQFDIKDVASTPTAAKGFADFRTFLEQYYTTVTTDLTGASVVAIRPDKNQILAALSSLRDWYIQAGLDAMNATDTYNRNAFMFGGTGGDTLTGGTGNDLLAGNGGTDTLTGGAGDDQLLGGAADDTLDGGAGYDTYTLEGRDTIRDSDGKGIIKDKAGNQLSGIIKKQTDGTYTYLPDPGISVTLGTNLTLTKADGSIAVIENFRDGDLGFYLVDQTTHIAGDITQAGVADRLNGNTGNDIIEGKGGADVLLGGTGNDTLQGGDGNDVYVYNIGDGVDHIVDSSLNGQINILRFGNGISVSNIVLRLGSLMLDLGNGDMIHIDNFDPSDAANSSTIQNFEFADGTVLTAQQLVTTLGFDLVGTTGNDTLTGTNVDDRISGGKGNDTLSGGIGNDTYLYNAGDGADTIVDSSAGGQINTLHLGAGITAAQITTSTDSATGQVILNLGAGDSINVGAASDLAVQTIQLADGTSLGIADVLSPPPTPPKYSINGNILTFNAGITQDMLITRRTAGTQGQCVLELVDPAGQVSDSIAIGSLNNLATHGVFDINPFDNFDIQSIRFATGKGANDSEWRIAA